VAGQAFEYRSDELQSLESDATDPFGHRDYANTVVAELRNLPGQFTLGLFGDWGSGKSTILKQIGKQLRADETTSTAYVLFDAWRYEGDSLRREFIRTVGEELDKQGALKNGFDLDRHTEAFETETTVSRRRLAFDPRALRDCLVAALLVAAVVAALILLLPKLGLSQATTLKVMIGISSAATAFVLFALQRVVAPDPIQATRRRLEFPDQFAGNFKELLRNVRVRRLVIAIDNLDRCSPGRVTEILSSVKTFLEPAFAEGSSELTPTMAETIRQLFGKRQESLTRMCFIVAADDAALRRHLTAQELSKKSWTGDGSAAKGDLPIEVRTAVDEYLRKFFGASLRIRGLLDEDIRRFTADELKQFNRSRGLGADLSRRLVELTSQGLKRNPRRIKQFVNNLQLRLQMLAERKEQERIQIDADVLVVAKLAIIEEEFVEEFEELEKDPTLLGAWHIRARAPDEESDERPLNPQFASFLRFTDDIQPQDIRAYLNLKQTKSELRLPRYGEFVDLLDDGDVERLEQTIGEEAGQVAKYTEAARTHLLEQRRAGSWSRAHNTLRSIIEVPLLHGNEGEVARKALEVALQEPALEKRLGLLEPGRLLNVAAQYRLSKAKLERVLAQVTETLGPQVAGDARRAAAEALAEHDGVLGEQQKHQIRQVLNSEEVISDFDSYLPLAMRVPEVLTHEILDAALNRIEEMGATAVATGNSAFAVAVQTLVTNNDPDRTERLLRLSQPGLAAYVESGSEEFGPVAAQLARAVAAGTTTESAVDLAGWLVNNRGGIPPNSRQEALGLALLLASTSPEADAIAGPGIADWIFDPGGGAAASTVLEENFDRLSPKVLDNIKGPISATLAGENRGLSEKQIQDGLSHFPPEDQVQIIRAAAGIAISLERSELAGSLLSRLEASERYQVLADSLSRAEEAPASHVGEIKFVIAQRSQLSEELYSLGMKIAQTLHEDRGSVQQLAPLLGEIELSSPERRLELVEQMINTERDMSDQANREAMLRAAWQVAGKHRSKARSAVEGRLQDLRADPSVAALVSELL
jgi:hypothetical protein